MRWASACSTEADSASAATAVAAHLARELGPGPVDLVLVFLAAGHVPSATAIVATIREYLRPGCLMGVSANGVVSREHEIESGPSLSVVAGRMPGVTVSPFIVTRESWTEAGADPATFAQVAPGASGSELVIFAGDPFSLDTDTILDAFQRQAPGCRVVGGMASASPRPGGNVLVLNDWSAAEGGVAVALSGPLRVDVVVSQGCRPIGPPLQVTRAQGNVMIELDGVPALERTEQVLRALPEGEREHLRHGLYVGRPVKGSEPGRADYLIRNLLGADRERGLLAIGDQAEELERIRLHVRDGKSAQDDMEMLLSPQAFDTKAQAAFLFLCNGRGRGLHGRPDGDLGLIQSALGGPVPVAGMFCAGEIGPLGERNYVHGHTASIAILRPAVKARG